VHTLSQQVAELTGQITALTNQLEESSAQLAKAALEREGLVAQYQKQLRQMESVRDVAVSDAKQANAKYVLLQSQARASEARLSDQLTKLPFDPTFAARGTECDFAGILELIGFRQRPY